MMIEPKNPGVRRRGALIAVLGGGGAAMISGARHLENTGTTGHWPMIVDVAAAVMIVAAIAILVFSVVRAGRR